jgi:hypothetical protein
MITEAIAFAMSTCLFKAAIDNSLGHITTSYWLDSICLYMTAIEETSTHQMGMVVRSADTNNTDGFLSLDMIVNSASISIPWWLHLQD